MSFTTRKADIGLWIVQGILGALFIFGGGYKLVAPMDVLAKMTPFPALFIKFIGVCELSGGLGLLLPGIFRIRTELTPIAAAGLTIIMVGAVATTVLTLGIGQAIFPLIVGVLTATIARGRWQLASHFRTAAGLPGHFQVAGGR